jgi:tetratricopeptide (TPR) repeat protein
MHFDPDNSVVALCAAGMAVEGDAEQARALFERAWSIRRDDYEASIAAHFLARHQPTIAETLAWNEHALRHATTVNDGRTAEFLASLYLNVGDSYLAVGRLADAATAAELADANLAVLPAGGYRDFVERGIRGLAERIAAAARDAANTPNDRGDA